jgi:transposase
MSGLTMRKISEIFRQHHQLGSTYRQIARSLNISTSTVSSYLEHGKEIGWSWPLPDLSEDELHHRLTSNNYKIRHKKPVPDWEWVAQELRRKGVTLQLLWREYRQTTPNGLGYSKFCHAFAIYRKSISPVMHQVHKAGEKCFVDYAGMIVPWIDPITGEIHEAQIFIGSLGASQYSFVEATATQQLPDWIQSHARMFEFFGGVPTMLVPDNLKSGVTKTHRYDPDINANYQLMGEHYGIAIVPARAIRPKDKAKVESMVGIVERQILAVLRDTTFTGIAEINASIKPLMKKINAQPFQKMKISRHELFESIDRPALQPLPQQRYQMAEWKKAKINIDYHFIFNEHFYSVPWKYIHHAVDIRATANTVECFYKSERIAVHAKQHKRYAYSTLEEHMPPSHLAHKHGSSPDQLKRWAEKIGPQTASFIQHMMASRAFPEQAYRACLGVLRLAAQYGEMRLELACTRGLEVGATRYQHIQNMLKNKLENEGVKEAKPSVVLQHQNIRGPKYYH